MKSNLDVENKMQFKVACADDGPNFVSELSVTLKMMKALVEITELTKLIGFEKLKCGVLQKYRPGYKSRDIIRYVDSNKREQTIECPIFSDSPELLPEKQCESALDVLECKFDQGIKAAKIAAPLTYPSRQAAYSTEYQRMKSRCQY